MALRTNVGRAVALIGAAAAGLLVAHELDYRLVVPDPLHRHDLLLRSGHGYLSRALFIGLVIGVVALVTSVALGFVRGRGRGGLPAMPLRSTVGLLAIVQSGGFLVLEGVERVIVGAPPDDRLVMVTLTGVVVQLAAAALGALLLRLFEGAGAVAGRAIMAPYVPPVGAVRHVALPPADLVVRAPALSVLGPRAPPAFARP